MNPSSTNSSDTLRCSGTYAYGFSEVRECKAGADGCGRDGCPANAAAVYRDRDALRTVAAEDAASELPDALVLAEARRRLVRMTDEQRHEAWNAMLEGYCRFCGVAHPARGTCQCWNDE